MARNDDRYLYDNAAHLDQGQQPEEVVSTGNWMLTLFLTTIPIVNIIMLFVWAFGSSAASKRNYAKAALIWILIGIILSVVAVLLFVFVAAPQMDPEVMNEFMREISNTGSYISA